VEKLHRKYCDILTFHTGEERIEFTGILGPGVPAQVTFKWELYFNYYGQYYSLSLSLSLSLRCHNVRAQSLKVIALRRS